MQNKPCLGNEGGQLTITLSLDLSEDFALQALSVVIQAWDTSCRQCISVSEAWEDYPQSSLLYSLNFLTEALGRLV